MKLDLIPEHSHYLEEKRHEHNIFVLKFYAIWGTIFLVSFVMWFLIIRAFIRSLP